MPQHFDCLSAYHNYMNWSPPQHKQVSIMTGKAMAGSLRQTLPASQMISTSFYSVKLVNFRTNHLRYGRGQYDFQSGSLVFLAPQQCFSWDEIDWQNEVQEDFYFLTIHEDFLLNSSMGKLMSSYGFFEYRQDEALHISEAEKASILNIFQLLEQEVSHYLCTDSVPFLHLFNVLMTYCSRFYWRQFGMRGANHASMATQLQSWLGQYYQLTHQTTHTPKTNHAQTTAYSSVTLPNVSEIAQALAVSPRYLNDALKQETGMTAQENVHAFLLHQAKTLLRQPNARVSQVAYQLGFDNPPYFSRWFRKKMGVSPSQYQQQQ